MSHRHTFSVDTTCACGMQLSTYTQELTKENERLIIERDAAHEAANNSLDDLEKAEAREARLRDVIHRMADPTGQRVAEPESESDIEIAQHVVKYCDHLAYGPKASARGACLDCVVAAVERSRSSVALTYWAAEEWRALTALYEVIRAKHVLTQNEQCDTCAALAAVEQARQR